MTRESLNEQIEELKKLLECVSNGSLARAALLGALNTLKDIRDNGITDIKYTVKVIPDDSTGYLSRDGDGTLYFGDKTEQMNNHPSFTQSEIEEFKKRDDIAIDWDKAKIEPVEEE